MKRLVTTFFAFVLAAGAAFAAEFTEVDADNDGKVTMEEATAMMPDLTEDAFKQADADGDGSLNEEEFGKLGS